MRLGDFMKSKNMSVKEFAKELGISVETVRGMLYERASVSSTLAKKIYAYTEHAVSIEDIILNKAGWERCPCCSQTLSDDAKIDFVVLEAAKEHKRQLESIRDKAV